MRRALAFALSLVLTTASVPQAAAGPLVSCHREAKGAFGMISASAVVATDTGRSSGVYANWYANGMDGEPGLTLVISFISDPSGDRWDPAHTSLMVSYDGRRPAQSIWASITLDDGDSRVARATGIGPEYDDDGDRFADFQDDFAAKVLKQPHVTVEVAAADGTVLASEDVEIRRDEAETALSGLLTGLKDDVAHYKERCMRART